MVKLEKEKEIFENYLNSYKSGDHNEIYYLLENVAKGKYLKGIGVKEFQEEFFIYFILNGEQMNPSLYNDKLHKRLIKLRRKNDNCFLLNIEL